jgi:hypothetical protein
MSARQTLEIYLRALLKRVRALILLRAAAVCAVVILALAVLSVWLLRHEDFSASVLMAARISLIVATFAVAWTLARVPLRRMRTNPGSELERRLSDQHGRIQTFLDANQRRDPSPLTELLASDVLARNSESPDRVVSDRDLGMVGAVGLAALVALIGLLIAGPAHWGYGTRYLLLGSALPRNAIPLRQISVTPGDMTVRRNSDLTIRAVTEGFSADTAEVFVRLDDEQTWERATMQLVSDGTQKHWQFKLFAIRGPLHYYVQASAPGLSQRSAQHAISIVDLPRVERMRLTYRYPNWTGLADHIDDVGRKIRAVEGTRVQIEVFADAPLQSPVISSGDQRSEMKQSAMAASGELIVQRGGAYHISSRVADEWVALTDDYPIEIIEDTKPSVEIKRPGRDWQATSIEEVPVSVRAQDDFNLQQVALRYSVNGGDWQTLALGAGMREAEVESLLRLEDLGADQHGGSPEKPQLQPGDLVSYYAVAKDRQHSVETDLFMVQVQPFERRFSEGQGGGAGGGMGDEQGAISERQREILLATWNLLRSQQSASRSRSQLQESAVMLSEMQTKLAAQAHTLSQRMRARMSVEDDERVAQFVESLDRAAAVMEPAAEHLHDVDLQPAIPVEQQALQHLLRAEAAFRDVQVAMQRSNSGGGQEAAKNFTEMFELEMDVDKNHYETQSQLSERNDRDELDDAIRRLKALAERQERLAQQMNRSSMSQQEQRWRQEQLRREAEDLQRRLAQMEQRSAQGASSAQEQSSASSGSEARDSQATQSIRSALEEMRKAGGSSDSQDTQRSAKEAGRNLRKALETINQPQEESLAQAVEQMADRTGKLSSQQQRVESELYQALGEAMNSVRDRGQLPSRQAQKLIETKQQMADELARVQQEMRAAANDYRSRSPQATQRLAQALSELEDANLSSRLNRSAAEIRYGRARDAAPREGLIADALHGLEENLRAAARLAAGESQREQPRDANELLAELGDLRRALQQTPESSAESQQSSSERTASPTSERTSPTAQDSAQRSLAQWTPNRASSSQQLTPSATLQEAQGRAQELDDMAAQGERMGLSAQQIDALRRLARQVRQLNASATSRLAALSLIDQLELAALSSAEGSRKAPSARSSVEPDESDQREVLAEYYRRLGGSCGAGEGASPC